MVHFVCFSICIILLIRSPAKDQAHEVVNVDDDADGDEFVDILGGGEEDDEEMDLPDGEDDEEDPGGEEEEVQAKAFGAE